MPVTIFKTTTNDYKDFEIAASDQIREIQFAVSAPYSASYQIAKDSDRTQGQPVFDQQDLIGQPGQGAYSDGIRGIRFKSFDGINQTVVLAIAYFFDDPTPSGFIGSTAQFTSSGVIVPTFNGLTGKLETTGATIGGSGFTSSRIGVGQYRVVFDTAFANAPVVLGICQGSPDVFAVLASSSTTGFDMNLYNAATAATVDARLQFVVFPLI